MATAFDAVIRKPCPSMLIVCPHCASSYEIKTAALGDEGRSVRCVRCQTVWFASPREVVLEAAGAADVMAEAAQPEAAAADEAEFHAEASEPAATADIGGRSGRNRSDGRRSAAMPQDMPQDMASMSMTATVEPMDGAPPLAPGQDGEHPAQPQFAPGEGPFPITGGDIEAFQRRRATKRAKEKRASPCRNSPGRSRRCRRPCSDLAQPSRS